MLTQARYFIKDINRVLGRHKIRVLHIWLGRVFWGLFLYRLERGLFTSFGTPYKFIRIIFIPFFNIVQAYSNMDIHYEADIKGGLLVLHPSVGCVISGKAIIGENLTLTGGNIIGCRDNCKKGELIIGDGCTLGANAVILGPVRLANKIYVGASACVVKNCLIESSILVGVPANEIGKRSEKLK